MAQLTENQEEIDFINCQIKGLSFCNFKIENKIIVENSPKFLIEILSIDARMSLEHIQSRDLQKKAIQMV